MSKLLVWALLALTGSMLAACATPYQSSIAGVFGVAGGYSDEQLADGIWRVRFSGNVEATQETIQTYWLYRCAELALAKGYDGFAIVAGGARLSRRGADEQRPIQLAHAAATPIFIPIAGPQLKSMEGNIQLVKQPFDPAPPKLFDATALKQALEPHVTGEKCDHGNICPHPHDYLRPPE